jgi:amino acid permease
MFSIVNEIKDNSPGSIVGVIGSSIGSAASIYILVAIAGYLTFGNNVVGNIVSMYPPSVASTIAKAAIVILVTFSIPLQVHPCRASLDAVLKWRPSKSSAASTRSTSPGGRPLLGTNVAITRSDHGPAAPMSDWTFALLTTVILVLSYFVALSVSSLDRVLAYVGSTGSTSISFILPGLFYYKISDPEGIHHQRFTKEDDDVVESEGSDAEELVESGLLSTSIASVSGIGKSRKSRRKWTWDPEHLDHGLLRRLSLALAIYGICVMIVCLGMNMVFTVAH